MNESRHGRARLSGVVLSLVIHAALIGALLWKPSAHRVPIPRTVAIQMLPPATEIPQLAVPKEKQRIVALDDLIREQAVPIRVLIAPVPALQAMEIPDSPVVESDLHVAEPAAPPIAAARPSEEKASSSDYAAQLANKLEQVKNYPGFARANRQVGTVLLFFTLERSGRLLAWHIARSSGYESLDAEAGSMLAKATPFPPFPDSLAKPSESFVVPIEFSRD